MRNSIALALDLACWLAPLALIAHRLRQPSARAPDARGLQWPALTAGRIAIVLALGQLLLWLALWLTAPHAVADATFRPASVPDLIAALGSWLAVVLTSLLVLGTARLVLRVSPRWPAIARSAVGVLATWSVTLLAVPACLGLVLAAHLAWAARDYGKLVPVTLDGAHLQFAHAPAQPALDYAARNAAGWQSDQVLTESLTLGNVPQVDATQTDAAAADAALADAAMAAARLSAQTPLLRVRPARADDALIDACAPFSDRACAGMRHVAEIGSPWPFIARTPLAFLRECVRTMRGVLLGLPAALKRRDLDSAARFFALDAEAAAHYVDRPADTIAQTLIHRANPRHGHAFNPFPALLVALWMPMLLSAWLLSPVHVKPVTLPRRDA